MAITITGGKYAVASLNAVGTTTISVGTTPFVSGDFGSNKPRIVGLWNSAGTTFKGMAYVRRYLSTSSLELERAFFDPATGATVTQVSGDTILVSKNWADIVTTGISVDNDRITLTDTITFGTASDPDSVCFHDEAKYVRFDVGATYIAMTWAGGLFSQGHIEDYSTAKVYGGTKWSCYTATDGRMFGVPGSTSAHIVVAGGGVIAPGAGRYPGWGNRDSSGQSAGTEVFMSMEFDGIDVISPNAGGNHSANASRHVVESCAFVSDKLDSMLLRWGDGLNSNSTYKIKNGSNNPIAVTGSEVNGSYSLGASAGKRSIVSDIGGAGGSSSGQVFWRSYLATTFTVTATNVITTDKRAGYQNTPESVPLNNATINWYYSDNYTNLLDATKLALIRDSDWTTDDTDTSSGSASTVALTAYHSQTVGHTVGSQRGPWTTRIRKYGYDEIEATVAESDYSLGTSGTAKNVSFGGLVNQIARSALTDSEATALAYTGITITDHGASPVTWNSKSWSITIEVDLATYPSRTAAQVFAHVKAKIASLSTWGGKSGLLWHVLMEESGSDYVSQRGKSGGAGASLKGVRIIDQAGNPLPGVVGMVADDGTTYVPPIAEERGLSFINLIAGSQVVVFETGTQTEIFRTNSSATSEEWSESVAGSITVDYTIRKAGYRFVHVTGVTVTAAIVGGVLTVDADPQADRTYVASSGLTYTTDTTATVGTKLFTLRIASTVQNWYSHMVEVWIAQAAFANVEFPLSTNGPNSITLGLGWEWRGWTTAGTGVSNTSLALLSRDGMRYVNTSGVTTASWAAILSAGVSAGMRVRYQQSDGGTTNDAAATGNIDQLIQIYGDASHGNFDRTGYLVAKVQEMGYDQAEVDVVAQYGTLEDQLYVIALQPLANGIATGNPSLANPPTITDHAGSPVTWNSKAFSITITDSAAGNSGTNIMRWLRYYFETGGTFQGKDAFNWHDLVQTNGSEFKTVRGAIYGDTGASIKGVRVVQNDGTTAHNDVTLHTADDGTTVSTTPPAQASATVLADTRVQLYNVTTATEIDNAFVTGTSYAYTITTEASIGNTLRLRVCKKGRESDEALGVWTATGVTFLVSQPEDTIYTAWGIDGATVSEFSLDVTGTVEIDANDVDGSSTKTRLGAWYSYILTTADGIRNLFGAISFLSTAAIRINVDTLDLQIENTNATTALRFTDLDVRLYRSDGTSIIAPASYSIHNDYSGVPDVVETGVSGLTGSESAQLMSLTNAPSAATVADAVFDEVIEAGRTFRELTRINSAALAGTSTKAGNTITFKGIDGTTDRIVGSFDAENNRTGAVLDGS